jgi:uncharacterized membrane protein
MLYSIVVTVHVLAAVVWIGGVLFIGAVLLPAAKQLDDATRRQVISLAAKRFRLIGWAALLVLIGTGSWMAWSWGMRPATIADGSFFAAPRHRVLGLKMLLVLLMATISGLHDWWLGPRTAAAAREGADPRQLRKRAMLFGQATALLSVIIAALAVFVARPGLIP